MAQNRIGLGHLISGIGATIALASLWLPWLSIDMDKVRQEPAFQAALQAGGISEQITAEINRFLALLPGTIKGNGWDVMARTDIAFAIGAAAVIALIYATVALSADARATARTLIVIGMVGMLLVLAKMISPGIPDGASSFVGRGPGFLVALIGWTVCAAGGIFAIRNPAPPTAEPVIATYSPLVAEPPAPLVADPLVPEAAASEPVIPDPLVPEYVPDPSRVAGSIAPPPRT